MLTSRALLLPSVPTMLIDEQRGDITEMIEALSSAGERMLSEAPDAVVIVSPRWVSSNAFQADDGRRHRSVIDLPGFGVEPRYDCPGHPVLARTIVEHAVKSGLRASCAQHGVDTAASIPLHFLVRARHVPIVPLSISEGSAEEHRAWGAAIRHALNAWEGRAAFCVGGALSWYLHAFNLRRDVPEGVELDKRVLEAIENGAWSRVQDAVEALGEKAHPEADLKHLEVLRGFLLIETGGHVREYESTHGIGTALAEFPLSNTAAPA